MRYFPDLHIHDLRHEAPSRFFEKGLNIMEVAAITGHKDLKMLKRYTTCGLRTWRRSWGELAARFNVSAGAFV